MAKTPLLDVRIAKEAGPCSMAGCVTWCEIAVIGLRRCYQHADAELQAEMQRVEHAYESECARCRIFDSPC